MARQLAQAPLDATRWTRRRACAPPRASSDLAATVSAASPSAFARGDGHAVVPHRADALRRRLAGLEHARAGACAVRLRARSASRC